MLYISSKTLKPLSHSSIIYYLQHIIVCLLKGFALQFTYLGNEIIFFKLNLKIIIAKFHVCK